MRAALKNYRQSPRKVRLVTNLVKGKRVPVALDELRVLPKRAGEPVRKLILSAVSNSGLPQNDLLVKDIRVDKGLVLKRYLPTARGRATQFHKHSSHVSVLLTPAPPKKIKKTKQSKS